MSLNDLMGALSLHRKPFGLACKCEANKICAFTWHNHSTFLSNTALHVIESPSHTLYHTIIFYILA